MTDLNTSGRSPAEVPPISDAQCLAAMREFAAQKGESHDAMWSQMDEAIRAEVLGEWRAVLECAGVGRERAEVPPPDDWRVSDEVQKARNTIILDAVAFEWHDDAYALAVELSEPLDALCAAVWRSAQQ